MIGLREGEQIAQLNKQQDRLKKYKLPPWLRAVKKGRLMSLGRYIFGGSNNG